MRLALEFLGLAALAAALWKAWGLYLLVIDAAAGFRVIARRGDRISREYALHALETMGFEEDET